MSPLYSQIEVEVIDVDEFIDGVSGDSSEEDSDSSSGFFGIDGDDYEEYATKNGIKAGFENVYEADYSDLEGETKDFKQEDVENL